MNIRISALGRLIVLTFLPVIALAILISLASTQVLAAHHENADEQATRGSVDLPRHPSVSPDGRWVVFSWRGDLWRVAIEGGEAVRLTSHAGDDLRSAWSDDGKMIAFDSTRSGYLNLHVMNADGSGVRQVTRTDRACVLSGFGVDADGATVLLFSSSMEGDAYRAVRPYMVSIDGGEIRRMHDAFGDYPTMRPGEDRVLFTRGGNSWGRRHKRGPDTRDVWIHDPKDESFTPVTFWAGNDGRAKWVTGNAMLFLSDRELDCVNLYRQTIDGPGAGGVERLTSFSEHDVQSFDVSHDGKTAVLHVWDTLYRMNLNNESGKPVVMDIKAATDERQSYAVIDIDREVSESALSPDGKVMAVVAYGEVFVRHVDDKNPTLRVTRSHAREKEIAWSPDGEKLYFVSDDEGVDSIYAATVALTREEIKKALRAITTPEVKKADEESQATEEDTQAEDDESEKDDDDDKDTKAKEKKAKKDNKPSPAERWHEAVKFEIQPVIATSMADRAPTPSPDGKHLLFRRGRGNLMMLNLESGAERLVRAGWDTRIDWTWSADSKWIAFAQADYNFNYDVFVMRADGSGEPVNVSRHPDNDRRPSFSADGKVLCFLSERSNDVYDVYTVYLDKSLEALTPRELDDYYKDAGDAAKKRKPLSKAQAEDDAKDDSEEDAKELADDKPEEASYDLADAYLRLRRITNEPTSDRDAMITPGGERIVFVNGDGLHIVNWDGSEQKRLGAAANIQHLTLTGSKAVVVRSGKAAMVALDGGKTQTVDMSGEMRVEHEAQARQKFLEAARALGEQFYHPTMKGLDWEMLTDSYLELAARTRTKEEFNDIANRLLGELNGSHLGVYPPRGQSNPAQPYGYLGIRDRRVDDGYEVVEVVPESPATSGEMALAVGDVITEIDFQPFGPTDTVRSMLRGRVGEETVVTVRRMMDAPDEDEEQEAVALHLLLTPTRYNTLRDLRYQAWQADNARRVDELSDGKLGYLHIRAMNEPSLEEFERDLFAATEGKQGLVIDVRNNGGGWITDRLLASIMADRHAYTVPRGGDPTKINAYPRDRLYIQRYILPINTLCNEKSFSNAEIFSHAFKTLGRGTLVGEQTNGGVISTGGFSLIDGTFVRLPFRGWFLTDDTDMENNGAMPDLLVPQTPWAEASGEDEQLEVAVKDLMKRVGSGR